VVFKSKLVVGGRVEGGCQLLSNVLFTDISFLCASSGLCVFSVITEVLLHPRWTTVVKFVLAPSHKPFAGPEFDPKPSECNQFPQNHFELRLYDNSCSYRRHFFQLRQFGDIQARVNHRNEAIGLEIFRHASIVAMRP